jgi:hypothetical protein
MAKDNEDNDITWLRVYPTVTRVDKDTQPQPIQDQDIDTIKAASLSLALTEGSTAKKRQWVLIAKDQRDISTYYHFDQNVAKTLALHNCALQLCTNQSQQDSIRGEFKQLLGYLDGDPNEIDEANPQTLTPQQKLIQQNNALCYEIAQNYNAHTENVDDKTSDLLIQCVEKVFKENPSPCYNSATFRSQAWNMFKKIMIGALSCLAIGGLLMAVSVAQTTFPVLPPETFWVPAAFAAIGGVSGFIAGKLTQAEHTPAAEFVHHAKHRNHYPFFKQINPPSNLPPPHNTVYLYHHGMY